MKNFFAIFCFFLLINQSAMSQEMKYHRVLITGPDLVNTLSRLQITIDHSHRHQDGIVTEIGDDEIEILKTNNINYKTLIYDLSTFYEQRNLHDQHLRASAAGICNEPNIKVPSHFRLGKMGGFFTLSEMEGIIDTMKIFYPSLITTKQPVSTIQSIEGRNIWFVKISDNPTVDENEPEVLYTSLHHAREGASLSQLIFYMWYLLENYTTDPDIKSTLDNRELFFVPCVNPDGYVYNESTNPNGGGMWRKNRRLNSDNTIGVDLNRNYGHNWGFDNLGSSPTPNSQTYRGTAAFSEPETQAMQAFCNNRQFKNGLNAHTFGNVLIYPWGHLPGTYTADSATFVNWGLLLTRDSRFLYGTCDQTLNYTTNGSADDWLYGEQTTKPKILSMTPEAGNFNDGFWPLSSRIVDICKTTFTQNYNLARLAGNYALAEDRQDKFLPSNGYIKYSVKKLGLGTGNFTVSISPVGPGIATTGAPKVYSTLILNQPVLDSISFTLNTSLTPGQKIRYELLVNSGIGNKPDTITKIYGTPVNVLFDNCSTMSNFSTVGTWGTTNTSFSPPSAITDSPNGDYSSNDHTSITVFTPLNLSNAVYAHMQYYTKFEIEKSFDEGQVLISTNNGGTFNPLCGIYETSPASFGGTYPVYDGRQDEYVKEDIDLSAYLGMNVLIRFSFDADFYTEKDGFYFDDFWVRKIPTSVVGFNEEKVLFENLSIRPNPSTGGFSIHNPDGRIYEVKISNALGQQVFEGGRQIGINCEIDLSEQPAGIYIISLSSDGLSTQKKIVIDK